VDYVYLGDYAKNEPDASAYEPDILWPYKPFQVKKSQLQPIYVNVYLPPHTPKGEYRGTVTVEANGQRISRTIVVNSFGFTLPFVNSLHIDPWYSPVINWGSFYGKPGFSLEVYENHLKVLSKYRHASFPLDHFAMRDFLTIYREADGTFTFDFSKWREIFRLGRKYGASGFGASFGCNGGAYSIFTRGTVIDRETGERLSVERDIIKDWREKSKAGEATFLDHPFYEEYWKEYMNLLRETGMLSIADFEMHDEPKSIPDWEAMIKHKPSFMFKALNGGADINKVKLSMRSVNDMKILRIAFDEGIDVSGGYVSALGYNNIHMFRLGAHVSAQPNASISPGE